MNRCAVGIDLGTTYSCVAVFQHGKVEIMANEEGNRTTASCVSFTEEERLVGDAAINKMSVNPENTVYDSKRMIGRIFEDESLQADMKHWPFKITNENGLPKINVEYLGENVSFTPEEISSFVLMQMKNVAECFISNTVKDAVITVPAHFNDAQREATKNAGKMAGLNVLRIINEPTAAAIAYGYDKVSDTEKKLIIFDLGGGTFDVSILSVLNGEFTVRATSGDRHLGGEDFDTRMVSHFVKEFMKKNKQDITGNNRSMRRLRTACEQAKRTLSNMSQANIELDSLYDGIDFYTNITRARFEEINGDLFRMTIFSVEQALEDAGMDKNEIDDVILIGGSSKIPKVQILLQEFFDGKELCKSINPDEAVAHGAAIQAAFLSGDITESFNDLVINDISSLSLGLATAGGFMDVLVKRNTALPAKETKKFTTYNDNQQVVMIDVYEGERALVKDNNHLGKFELSGIPPAPKGVPQIEVTFDVDINGIFNISAIDLGTLKESKLVVTKGRLNKEERERNMTEREENNEIDSEILATADAKINLETYLFQLKIIVEEEKLKKKEWKNERKAVHSMCQDIIKWLDTKNTYSKMDYECRYEELKKLCSILMSKMGI